MATRKSIYILLALLLGAAGVHKFYAGKWFVGLVYLVLMFVTGGIASGILAILDALRAMLAKSDQSGCFVKFGG